MVGTPSARRPAGEAEGNQSARGSHACTHETAPSYTRPSYHQSSSCTYPTGTPCARTLQLNLSTSPGPSPSPSPSPGPNPIPNPNPNPNPNPSQDAMEDDFQLDGGEAREAGGVTRARGA